jgi:MFS family permease
LNHPIITKVAWRLMPTIIICYFFAYFDRINISFAKFQLQDALTLSDTAYGLGASLFVIGYVIFEVPSNMLLYRFGARKWLARIIISWGLATAAMVFVQTPWQFYTLRFLIGAMEAGFAPGVLYYLTTWFPASHRGRITALLFLAPAFSGLVGSPLAGLILQKTEGLMGFSGWHWLFLSGGLPCVPLGLLVLRVLKDKVEDAPWLDSEEKRWLTEHIRPQHSGSREKSLLEAIKTPGFIALAVVYFLVQIGSYGLNFWAPHLIRTAGVTDASTMGLLVAGPYICGAIAMSVTGRWADSAGQRHHVLAGLLVIAAIGFTACGIFDHSLVILVVALAFTGLGMVAAIPAFWSLPPKLATGVGAAGGIALINTLGQMGGIVSPYMVGRIRDLTGSTTPALYGISGALLLGAFVVLFLLPPGLRSKEGSE